MLLKKGEYNAKIKDIEDEIPDIINLATYTTFNAKINEVKGEIFSINNLTVTAVESKIPDVNDLVKKEGYGAQIKYIKNKYFTTYNHDKFTNNLIHGKITARKLVNEFSLNEKIKTLAKKKKKRNKKN